MQCCTGLAHDLDAASSFDEEQSVNQRPYITGRQLESCVGFPAPGFLQCNAP
jgi:hypothetical protein